MAAKLEKMRNRALSYIIVNEKDTLDQLQLLPNFSRTGNHLDRDMLVEMGFDYFGIGR